MERHYKGSPRHFKLPIECIFSKFKPNGWGKSTFNRYFQEFRIAQHAHDVQMSKGGQGRIQRGTIHPTSNTKGDINQLTLELRNSSFPPLHPPTCSPSCYIYRSERPGPSGHCTYVQGLLHSMVDLHSGLWSCVSPCRPRPSLHL